MWHLRVWPYLAAAQGSSHRHLWRGGGYAARMAKTPSFLLLHLTRRHVLLTLSPKRAPYSLCFLDLLRSHPVPACPPCLGNCSGLRTSATALSLSPYQPFSMWQPEGSFKTLLQRMWLSFHVLLKLEYILGLSGNFAKMQAVIQLIWSWA